MNALKLRATLFLPIVFTVIQFSMDSAWAQTNLQITPIGSHPPLPVPTVIDSPRIVQHRGVVVEYLNSDFAHRRLLFEEPLLERHGIGTPRPAAQPFVSGTRFLGHTFLFPFEVIKGHHRRLDRSLDWGNPGSFGEYLK